MSKKLKILITEDWYAPEDKIDHYNGNLNDFYQECKGQYISKWETHPFFGYYIETTREEAEAMSFSLDEIKKLEPFMQEHGISFEVYDPIGNRFEIMDL